MNLSMTASCPWKAFRLASTPRLELLLMTELPQTSLVGQWGVCAVGNISYYNWVNAIGQKKGTLEKFKEEGTWLSKIDPDYLLHLFSCLELGPWGPWLESILQVGHILLPGILLMEDLIKSYMTQIEWI